MPILCRPDVLMPAVPLPEGVTVVGWSTGVAHDVMGAAYATARAAAFMGKRVLEARFGQRYDYTSEIESVDEVLDELPERMLGGDFVARHGGVDDPLSTIVRDRQYPVREATRFPIEEHRRVRHVMTLLEIGQLEEIGDQMRASHEAYGAMGLGAVEADQLVNHVQALGPARGFYGARISGGGSGGTVVVLADHDAAAQLPDPVIR